MQRDEELVDSRRRFLLSCGRFAAITPPAMTLLLDSAGHNFAVAGSGSAGSGSLGGSVTYFVPRDDGLITSNGGVKPGDTVCFDGPGGISCKPITPR